MFTLVLCSGPTFCAQEELPGRQAASQSLTLIKPTDPTFEDLLNTYFPGLSLEADYPSMIRPYLVLVRNDTGLPARAYAIRWQGNYQAGYTRKLAEQFITRNLMYGPAKTAVQPGAIRLVSPLFNVSPEEYRANPYFAQRYPPSHFPPSNGLTSVDAQIDGVVYTDQSFIGPNETHIWELFVAAVNGEHDEALGALNLLNSATSELVARQQLLARLNEHIQREVRAHGPALGMVRYVWARGQTAQDLQSILRDRGTSGLKEVLENYMSHSLPSNRFSSWDKVYGSISDDDPRVFGGGPIRPTQH